MTHLAKFLFRMRVWIEELTSMLGLIVFLVGSWNLMSFLYGRNGKSFITENSVPMAFETSAMFILVGLALIFLSSRVARLENRELKHE